MRQNYLQPYKSNLSQVLEKHVFSIMQIIQHDHQILSEK